MKEEKLHQAMMNSFNLITNKITYNDLFDLGKFYLVHIPDEPVTIYDLDIMIDYFEELEMYENCAELKKLLDIELEEEQNQEEVCECKNPKIYDDEDGNIKCQTCNKRFSWWK